MLDQIIYNYYNKVLKMYLCIHYKCISINIIIMFVNFYIIHFFFKLYHDFFFRSIPVYFKWLSFLSWFRYGNEALMINQWEDISAINCTVDDFNCPRNGHVVLQTFGFSEVSFTLLNYV